MWENFTGIPFPSQHLVELIFWVLRDKIRKVHNGKSYSEFGWFLNGFVFVNCNTICINLHKHMAWLYVRWTLHLVFR